MSLCPFRNDLTSLIILRFLFGLGASCILGNVAGMEGAFSDDRNRIRAITMDQFSWTFVVATFPLIGYLIRLSFFSFSSDSVLFFLLQCWED